MHYELMFPSLYLKAADLQGKEVTLTIREVVVEELTRQGGKKERKPIVYFEETLAKSRREKTDEKRMVMNKTNARSIAAKFGNDTVDWIGGRITLVTERVTFGSQTVDAIRISQKPPRRAGSGPPAVTSHEQALLDAAEGRAPDDALPEWAGGGAP